MNSFLGRWNFYNSCSNYYQWSITLDQYIVMLMKSDVLYCLGVSVKNIKYLVADKSSIEAVFDRHLKNSITQFNPGARQATKNTNPFQYSYKIFLPIYVVFLSPTRTLLYLCSYTGTIDLGID